MQRAVLAALFGVTVAGCGGSGLPSESEVSGLHFSTSAGLPGNPPPPNVDITLTDATRARAIYDATLALPDYPPGAYSCPADWGVLYTIAFMDAQKVATKAVLNPTGCEEVTITGSSTRRNLGSAYWDTLAQNLGIETSTISR